jgi:signal peptidase I
MRRHLIKDYLQPIFLALLIALFIRTFIVQAFKIPSGSMEPTLLVGDYLLVNKFIYGIRIPFTDIKFFQFEKPERGDIIVFPFPKDPSKDFIKRVMGTEGEKIEIIDGRIYVNDRLIDDPWGHFETIGSVEYRYTVENLGPVVVPKDSLFVMGIIVTTVMTVGFGGSSVSTLPWERRLSSISLGTDLIEICWTRSDGPG